MTTRRLLPWTRFNHSDSRKSLERKQTECPRNAFASCELVVVPESKHFGQSSGPKSKHFLPARNMLNDGRFLASAGALELVSCSFQLSNLDDKGFFRENSQFELETVLGPGVDSLLSPSAFNYSVIWASAENPNVFDEEEDKGNLLLRNPMSEGSTGPPR